MSNLVIFIEERVTLFRLSNTMQTVNHFLDHWREKIWEGKLNVVTNDVFLKL